MALRQVYVSLSRKSSIKRSWECQLHYLVILTVLYPCLLNSSKDILPEVRSSQTLRRPTERLKAACFSSFVSYTFIIAWLIFSLQMYELYTNFPNKTLKTCQRAPVCFLFSYSIGRIIDSINAISSSVSPYFLYSISSVQGWEKSWRGT